MNLYERNYKTLTLEEEEEFERAKASRSRTFGELQIESGSIRDYSKPARHFISLFPNNYLDIVELQDTERLLRELSAFEKLLNSGENGPREQEVLAFIRQTHSYFIVGSILNENHRFGHHDTFMFLEFPLGTTYQVDYLLIGKGSGGWEFVFVELEAPSSTSILKNGELGDPFRRGLKQIEDWREWLEANFLNLRETFQKLKRDGAILPDEFINLDMSRLHFVVIAGRRAGFMARTYRLQRNRSHQVLLLHYDNLLDYAKRVIGRSTY